MGDVADNGNTQFVKLSFVTPYGKHIEHGLCRMGVASIAGIDDADMGRCVLCDEMCGAAVGMPDDEHITVHCLQIAYGIEQGLALACRGGGNVDIEYICGKAFGRKFEGGAGAGAGLE